MPPAAEIDSSTDKNQSYKIPAAFKADVRSQQDAGCELLAKIGSERSTSTALLSKVVAPFILFLKKLRYRVCELILASIGDETEDVPDPSMNGQRLAAMLSIAAQSSTSESNP